MNNRLPNILRAGAVSVLLLGIVFSALGFPQPVQAASLPAEINKQFTPLQIDAGGVSVLRVTIFNPNAFDLTNASWTDNLVGVQPGLSIANPANVVNTCGAVGDVTAVPGTTTLFLSNGTVPAQTGPNPGECYVEVNVTSTTPGNLINTIPANNLNSQGNDGGTIVNITNTTPASATLTVIAVTPPGLSKGFSPNTIFVGEFSRLTITLNNNDSDTNLTGTSYTDTLPAGLQLANPVNASVSNCGVGYSLTAVAGTNTIALSDATISPSPNCVVAVDVTGASGLYTIANGNPNEIPAGPGGPGSIQTDQGVTNGSPARAELTIQPVDIDKSFSPTSFQAGGTTTLTITLENPTGSAYTNVGISDTLPGVFEIASPASATNSCGGTLTAVSGTKLISLSGGTIPASASPPTPVGSCVITVQVTAPAGSSASTSTNTIPAGTLTADQPGLTNITDATASISVYATGTGVGGSKRFDPGTIDPGQNTRLRIDLRAPADTNLTNFSVTDNLPTGVTISNSSGPNVGGGCIGGTLSAPTNGTTISWTGGTINAGQLCRIEVWVTSSTSGTVTNTIAPTDISNNENRRPVGNITRNLTVRTLSDLTISKAFYPDQVVPSGISTLTITLQNENALPLVNVALTDDLGTMGSGGNTVRVAPTPNASTTCGGSLTASAGDRYIVLNNGSIPAQVGGVPGICTITVDVQAQSNTSNRTNRIDFDDVSAEIQGTGTTMNALGNASAQLQTLNLTIGVVKGFNPVLVYGGAASTLSVQLINPNNATLYGITFTDDMTLLGTGMVIANPANLNVGTCGGALTGNPGDTSFSFSGGTLPPTTNCTLTLSVTMTVNGNLTNLIPVGAVTTLNGVSSPDPTQASLTNLPGVSVSKVFSPATVLTGQPSTLSITITNTSLVPVVNMGVTDNLPGTLPDGLEVANPANASNTCGGTLTAIPGAQNIQLTGGGLAAAGSPGDVCTVSVDVLSTRPGVYVNTIPAGALTADGGVTNNDPATDTLTVDSGVFSLGNRVWFDTDNSGTINGSEMGANGVTVQLYAADAGGNPTGAVLDTATTANGGYYRFDSLSAGDYVVVIPASQFGSGGALEGYWSSGTTMSGTGVVSETAAPDPDNNSDSDDNGTLQTAGSFNGAVLSGAITLGPGANEPTNDTDAAPTSPAGEAPDAQSNRTVDFGFYRGQLGNLVYVDATVDGTYAAGDTTLSGATVQLYAADGITEINVGPDGVFGTADDAAGGVTTAAGGTYLFSGLPEGDYIVRVTPPAGYNSTIDTAAPADTTDPDTNIDNNDNGVGTLGATVSSNAVTLAPGSAGMQTNNTVTNATGTTYDPTLDFGFQSQTPNIQVTKTIATVTFDTPQLIRVTYSILVENIGNVALSNIQVTDDLATTFALADSFSIVSVLSGTFTTNPSFDGDTDSGANPTHINLLEGTDSLALGANGMITLVVLVDTGGRSDIYTNTANVQGTPPSGPDVTDSDSIPGPNFIDPAVTKAVDPSQASVGDTVTFTIMVFNNGNVGATGVVVTDTLPDNLDYVSATSIDTVTSLPRGTITLTPPRTIIFDIGNLAVTDVIEVTIVTQVNSLGQPPIQNEVLLASGPPPGGVAPDLLANNVAAVSIQVGTPPDDPDDDIGSASSLPKTGFAPDSITALPDQTSEQAYSDLGDLWLEIPSLGVKTSIVGVPRSGETWNVDWLWEDAGWLQGSAFPTWQGNSVLTGHVYLPNGKPGPFVGLNKLRWGNQVIVHAFGQRYIYEVQMNQVALPGNVSILKHEEQAWITLVTCKGYDAVKDSYRYRVVIRAVLVKIEAEH